MTAENALALKNVIIFIIKGYYESHMISRNEVMGILNTLNLQLTEELSRSYTDPSTQ